MAVEEALLVLNTAPTVRIFEHPGSEDVLRTPSNVRLNSEDEPKRPSTCIGKGMYDRHLKVFTAGEGSQYRSVLSIMLIFD